MEALFLAEQHDAGGAASDHCLAGLAVLEFEGSAVFEDAGEDELLDGLLVEVGGVGLLDLVFGSAQERLVGLLEEPLERGVVGANLFVELVAGVERVDEVIPEAADVAANGRFDAGEDQAERLPDEGAKQGGVDEFALLSEERDQALGVLDFGE